MEVTEELTKKTCFVVTPIGNADEPIRRHIDGIINAVIKPAIGEKYEIEVAHEMTKIGSINKQVIEAIYKSDLVIANLTNKNPNVMYELAFRHCLGKPVIQIAEKGTVLPFDIGTERTIPYSDDAQGVLDLIDEIKEFEKKIDFKNNNQGPIYDILKSINNDDTIIKMINANHDEDNGDTKQLLKYMINKFDDLDNKISIRDNINYNVGMRENKRELPSVSFRINNFEKFNEDKQRNIIKDIMDEIEIFSEKRPIIYITSNDKININLKGARYDLNELYHLLFDTLKLHSLELVDFIKYT